MRFIILILVCLSLNTSIKAQTICTKITPYFEKLASSFEKVLIKEAVYRYDIIPGVEPLYEYAYKDIVVSDAYEKVVRKPDGTYCTISVEAIVKTIQSVVVIREGQAPQVVKTLISPAVYETIPVVHKVKDGKVIVTNAICD